MAFPLAAISGAALGISAARNFFSGNRGKTNTAVKNLESLRPRIRSAGLEATGAQREAITRFRDFDALAGFDEELASRTRAPLEQVRDQANAAGTFRSGRAVQDQNRVVSQEAAGLLTARQRLQLQANAGLSQAGSAFGRTSLDFLGAESDLESGLADFFGGKTQQGNEELFSLFKVFLSTQGLGK